MNDPVAAIRAAQQALADEPANAPYEGEELLTKAQYDLDRVLIEHLDDVLDLAEAAQSDRDKLRLVSGILQTFVIAVKSEILKTAIISQSEPTNWQGLVDGAEEVLRENKKPGE